MGKYRIGPDGALYWRPTMHSPERRLTQLHSEDTYTAEKLHRARITEGKRLPPDWPPCIITYHRNRRLPWSARWLELPYGELTSRFWTATRQAALESHGPLLRKWQALGLGFNA